MSGTVSPAPSPLGSDSGRAHEEPQVQEREKEAESGEARTAGYRRIGSGCESKRARRTTSTSMDASQEDVIIIEDEDDHVAVEDGIKGAGMFKLRPSRPLRNGRQSLQNRGNASTSAVPVRLQPSSSGYESTDTLPSPASLLKGKGERTGSNFQRGTRRSPPMLAAECSTSISTSIAASAGTRRSRSKPIELSSSQTQIGPNPSSSPIATQWTSSLQHRPGEYSPPNSPAYALAPFSSRTRSAGSQAIRTVAVAPADKVSKSIRRTSSLLAALDDMPAQAGWTRNDASTSRKKRQKTDELQREGSVDLTTNAAENRRKEAAAAAKKAAKEAEKQAKKREREQIKAQKEREMEERKRWNKANKLRVSKSETVRDMIVVMDESLVMPDGPLASVADTLRTRLQEKGATFSTGPACNPPLIQWRRKVRARLDASGQSWVPLPREEIDEEKTVLLYLTAKELVQHAQDKTLLTMVQTLRDGLSPTHQIFIMVRGLDAHFRKQQNAANRAYTAAVRNSLLEEGAEGPKDGTMPSSVAGAGAAPQPGTMSKEQIETELIRLKVAERCFVVQVSGLVDAVEWILSVTADISIRPYKTMRNSHLSFCPTAKMPTGSTSQETYLLMLQQIPRVTPHAARGIANDFPTLRALFESYANCETQSLAEEMLADCVIANTRSGTGNARVLNNAMSKRIWSIMQGDDPLALVGP